MTLERMQNWIKDFCEERDWDQFHGPKDLAIGAVTEAAELLDEFRFLSEEQALEALSDPAKRERVEGELADVLFFVLRFAQRFDVTLEEALKAKLQRNAEKYPVDKAFGKNAKSRDL